MILVNNLKILVLAFLFVFQFKGKSQGSLEAIQFYDANFSEREKKFKDFKLYFSRDSCIKGIDMAVMDCNNGVYKIGGFGLPAPMDEEDWAKVKAYRRILQDRYNIQSAHYGCAVETVTSCYSSYMRKEVERKFSSDIFESAMSEVDSLWKVGKIDIDVRFPGGQSELNKFLACNIRLNKNGDIIRDKSYVIVELKFNNVGQIEGYTFDENKNTVERYYEDEVVRLISMMPDWLPKKEEGKNVASSKRLRINFSYEFKNNFNCN